ncbi:unnamed protein product, partial [Rotaria sordida]
DLKDSLDVAYLNVFKTKLLSLCLSFKSNPNNNNIYNNVALLLLQDDSLIQCLTFKNNNNHYFIWLSFESSTLKLNQYLKQLTIKLRYAHHLFILIRNLLKLEYLNVEICGAIKSDIYNYNNIENQTATLSSVLKHLIINSHGLTYSNLILLLKQFQRSIQLLKLDMCIQDHVNGEIVTSTITSTMPKLKELQFVFRFTMNKNVNINTANATTTTTLSTTTTVTATTTITTQQPLWTPLRGSPIDIPEDAHWEQRGVTVAGGNGEGNGTNQFYNPDGLFVDDEETLYIADQRNHRIIQWRANATTGQVVAGGNGKGNETHQLQWPTDVIVDKETDSLIICDNGIVVAGGHGLGSSLKQLQNARGVVVDQLGTLYVSDDGNDRIMRWPEGATQGSVAIDGKAGQWTGVNGLSFDHYGNLYVVNFDNYRVRRFDLMK